MPPPPHPIDRSRLVRYVTSRRIRCPQSGAYSSLLNPRNLEADYYPAYSHTLADLVDFEFEGAITVAQQFNIWLSKATFDLYKVKNYWLVDDVKDNSVVEAMLQQPAEDSDDDDDDNDDAMDVDENDLPENILIAPAMSSSPPRAHASTSGRPARNAGPPPKDPKDFLTSPEARAALTEKELTQEEVRKALENIEIRKNRAENPSDATEADTSIRTMATVHDPGAMDAYPDMLLCHWYAADVEMPADPGDVFGWERRARCKILHQCFPLIMEIKGCPSRSLRGKKLERKKTKHLQLAAGDLYTYVQSYFARDVCAEHVIAMIACGPYWQWRQVAREEVEIGTGIEDHPNLVIGDLLLRPAFVAKLLKAPTFILATEASDDELTRLRDEFLIPLIEDHHRYPSTMVPNPQPEGKKGEEGGQGGHEAHEAHEEDEEDEEDEENGGYQFKEDDEDEDEGGRDDEDDEDDEDYEYDEES